MEAQEQGPQRLYIKEGLSLWIHGNLVYVVEASADPLMPSRHTRATITPDGWIKRYSPEEKTNNE